MIETTEKRKCERCKVEFSADLAIEKGQAFKQVWCTETCKKKMRTCVCHKCEKEFISYSNKKYCSDTCRTETCTVCDRLYVKKNNETYCSDACKQKKFTHICISCEQPFFKHATTAKYCSDACQNVFKQADKTRCICKTCRRPFVVLGTQKQPFCSYDCRYAHNKQKKLEQERKELRKTTVEELLPIVRARVTLVIEPRLQAESSFHTYVNHWNSDGFTGKLKEEVKKTTGNRCFICECQENNDVHHIVPRRLGGAHEEKNLVPLCRKCHRYIETGDIEHAVKKCFKRIQVSYGHISFQLQEKEKPKNQMENVLQELGRIYENLSEKNSNQELQEQLIDLTELLDKIEQYTK